MNRDQFRRALSIAAQLRRSSFEKIGRGILYYDLMIFVPGGFSEVFGFSLGLRGELISIFSK